MYTAVRQDVCEHDTSAVATATDERIMTGFDGINDVVATHPALSSLIDGACRNVDSLNAGEAARFNLLLRCCVNPWWKLLN